MLVDVSASRVILGHSESRKIFRETDGEVGLKVAYTLKTGLKVIAYVGEKLEEREKNQITKHVSEWIHVVVAY
ncbi:triosephosphate isomerase [Podila epicladia]|nr:triosephosphate isomerase [Podila epicladia]KAG0096804.1 triosephosphate isomerase [Podila epicladia]